MPCSILLRFVTEFPIQIKIFADALQVWSPGFLPYNMTVEDLLNPEHASKPRNKLIAQTFYDIGLIERYGSGIHRILEGCQSDRLPEPLFENFSGGFRIKFTLPEPPGDNVTPQVTGETGTLNGTLTGTLNGTLNKRIEIIIRQQPGIQRKDIIHEVGASIRTVARTIAELVSEGKIERRGSKKTGGYYPTSSKTEK